MKNSCELVEILNYQYYLLLLLLIVLKLLLILSLFLLQVLICNDYSTNLPEITLVHPLHYHQHNAIEHKNEQNYNKNNYVASFVYLAQLVYCFLEVDCVRRNQEICSKRREMVAQAVDEIGFLKTPLMNLLCI